MPNILVRAATEDDFEAWYPLWRGYQSFYKADIAIEVSRVTWQRFFDPTEPMFCDLVVVDGQAQGLVHSIDHRSCWTVEKSCYLQDLFVAPAQRAQGLGRRLIEHVYAQAKARGCAKVHWLTHETNTDAMKLYDRIAEKPGFVQYRKVI
ncbi:MAG: GNAT family acetyltransferase [Methylibium sp. NZG]|nr:MAG: GNAT family acetyltransferase [Methylibium sp. NZG]